MTELTGNLWDYHKDGVVTITTNGVVRQKSGTCVMGRGVAYQAACRFPNIPSLLGARIKQYGLQVEYFEEYRLLIFPVKHVWWDKADLALIVRSAQQAAFWIDSGCVKRLVYMPRPGCGNGGLQWESVRPAIESILGNRVTIVNQ